MEGGGEEEGNINADTRNRNYGNVAEGEEHDDDDGGGKAKEDEDGEEEEATREDEAGAEVTFAL